MDLAQIKELLKIVAESGVAEVEIEEDEFKLVVRKNAPSVTLQQPMYPQYGMAYAPAGYPQAAPASAPQAAAPPSTNQTSSAPQPAQHLETAPTEGKEERRAENEVVVKAPIVGTFYRASSPDDDPFVNVGDSVSQGDVLCIIEAMKLMNEIECEVRGTVKKILAEDAQPVEYDQPLFIIETE